MKIDKIQMEILKELMKDKEKVGLYRCKDEESVLVCIRSAFGYKLPEGRLCVSLEGVNYAALEMFDQYSEYELQANLVPTDVYRRGGVVQRFLYRGDEEKPYYVNTKLLANFDVNFKLFLPKYNAKGPAIVLEYPFGEDHPQIVGFVCPVNLKEEE